MELYRSFTASELKMLLNYHFPVITGSKRCRLAMCSDCVTRLGTLNGRCVSASISCHIRKSKSGKIGHVVITVHPSQADQPGRHVPKPVTASIVPPLLVPETASGLSSVVVSIVLVGDLAVLKAVLSSSHLPVNSADLCWKFPCD